ncbi:glycosyltransferase family 4 protein [Nocardiopsis sp. RSe5-2]|uniref:Glycosyltransferase family 4 protein n=1 Tax=Nocardiopsis endophytica TaxID=3018445 RepID=A0ABT4U022_9ACTN|nr:glycosyltransferase family 4 protein [Nocardiopsis endophytica]MDA2810296.1 glycosyltransferase family 4 protein [Nocardiopsis endophytica]
MKIVYVLHTLYGIGGTIRTVANQAGAMAALGHEVEVVSVFRHRDDPVLPVGPSVQVTWLVDVREPPGPGADRPSLLYPVEEKHYGAHSALTDALIAERLAQAAPDVVVGTRAGINILLARLRPDGAAVVGQEHLTYRMYDRALLRAMARDYRRLDAIAPVTEADAAAYRSRMRLPGVRVQAVPNCVPAPELRTSGAGPPSVVAAGRVTGMKGFDLLLEAFARVAGDHPDWTVRVFGRGQGVEARRRQIHALGLEDRAFMMGAHPRMDEVWPLASVCAVPSRDEPFGMILVEAMRAGVPVVSSDCPHGPAEILRHGEDGLLVANEDPDAFARALDRVMGDDALRARMGAAALRNSERYSPEAVARMHEALFRDLIGPGDRTAVPAPRAAEPPDRCTAVVGADGVLELRFSTPPGLVVLRPVGTGAAGRQERRLCAEGARTVHVDPRDFPEGTTRWDVLRSDGGGAPVPVPASLVDLRSAPYEPRTVKRLAVAVPERGPGGRLRIAARRADRFAEVGGVAVAAERIAVSGTVLGSTGPDPEAELVLTARGDRGTEARFPCPVDASGRFGALVPAGALAEAGAELMGADGDEVVWDVRLRNGRGDHLVGRCLLGAGDWKQVCAYPEIEHPGPGGAGRGRTRIRPYITAGGHLAVRMTREEEALGPPPVRDVSVCWLPRRCRFEVSGTVRTLGARPGDVGVRLVPENGEGAPVDLPVTSTRTPAGVRFTAGIGLAGSARVPFGRWRVEVQSRGSDGGPVWSFPGYPGPRLRKRWWRGPVPVYAVAAPAKGKGTVIEHAPVRLLQAARRRVSHLPVLGRLWRGRG